MQVRIAARQERPVQLGFFTMPIHPLGKDWRRVPGRGPRGVHARRRAGLRRRLRGRACHRPRREHHLLRHVPRHPGRPRQAHAARHRHRQPAERASGGGGGPDRHARSPAGGPLQFRHQPRRPAVRCRGVRQSRRQPQRDVPRGHQPGAGHLGRRGAVRSGRQILEDLHGAHHHRARSARARSPSRCKGRIRRSSSPRSPPPRRA